MFLFFIILIMQMKAAVKRKSTKMGKRKWKNDWRQSKPGIP